ncbi:HNH endonuclease signature motif containing protein [uncultured Roseibium sp.]|uniref:HNH endonuclease n=1 Tax=uncultured Roseibium sp. TaxID=1936171 RepID=UPI0034207EC3
MPRLEFTRKTRAKAFERASGRCEKCSAKLKTGEAEYDHILPAELEGDNDLQNCQVLCRICHREKTTRDVQGIRKADRQRDSFSGAKKPKGRPLPGSRNSKFKRKMDGTVVPR